MPRPVRPSRPGRARAQSVARQSPQLLLLRVDLKDVKPAVWRRVLVPDRVSLAELHEIIQIAMGWQNCHLHEFNVGGRRFGSRHTDTDPDPELEEGANTALAALSLELGSSFTYTYDFGDDWLHQLTVEGVVPSTGQILPLLCVGGAGACPPEDCGGAHGYADLLAALKNPTTAHHRELIDWIGGRFAPTVVDLGQINLLLVDRPGLGRGRSR